MKRKTTLLSISLAAAALAWGTGQASAATGPVPTGINYDLPNYANSPLPTINPDGTVTGGLRKFVDSLPGLGPNATNNLNQFIPVAVPMGANTPAGVPRDGDYYEIALVEYHEQMHSDLPGTNTAARTQGTKLRGYVQVVPPGWTGTDAFGGTYSATPFTTPSGTIYCAAPPSYLGPLILATKNVPTRLKFTNLLPTGANGNLFIPVDTTIMGAGLGTNGNEMYTQNRAGVHLHGGLNPWINDGTPHQWTVPATESTTFKKGVTTVPVPDMPIPGDGSITFYYPNQQSGRFLFYHDHALGITRLNVYAGEAAGYLLVEPVERALNTTAGVVAEIPLVIQDKTFVWGTPNATPGLPGTGTYETDPTWATAVSGSQPGDLWFPHVYMPNQDPSNTNNSGANPLGRWDYGPWFWPPQNIGSIGPMPTNSCVPESFMDTPVVNGTAYPYVNVPAAKIRFRILNAANDRFYNLQMYQAAPLAIAVTLGGTGYTNPVVTITDAGGTGAGAGAIATAVNGAVVSITVTNPGTSFYTTPVVTITDPTSPSATGAKAIAKVNTEVPMVPAIVNPAINFPAMWLTQTPGMVPDILDNRPGGVPNPDHRGPAMIQIGTESGLLPAPVLLTNTPVGYERNVRNIVVLNVAEKTLFLGPAERADVIVDFSQYAGKTIILYSDSPAPVPAADPRIDYYTGNMDYSITAGANYQGGAPSTLPGYGPNTRTIMQFRVAGTPVVTNCPPDAYDPATLAALQAAIPVAYTNTQHPPILPQADHPFTYANPGGTNTYVRIQDNFVTFTPYGSVTPITMPLKPKCIHELFDKFGRMNSILGVELPLTSFLIQTTIPLEYIDPATEVINDGETQFWKITHNGVDTHAIHFHLVDVQVINRVGWDGAIRPPDANEMGWKETVRMNPLEDCIVGVRAKAPTLPFPLPNSIRPLDVTAPLGTTTQFTGVNPADGTPITVTNLMTDFGWEYVWHCHLLGHEENDMMRPLVMRVQSTAPTIPQSLTATIAGPPLAVNLNWFPPSVANQTSYQLQRVTGASGGTFTNIAVLSSVTTAYSDTAVAPNTTYRYRVIAVNGAGSSLPSNVASITTPALPAAPSNLTATLAPGTRYAILNWRINGGLATGFIVTRTGGAGPVTFTLGAGVATMTDAALDPGVTYTYTVVAFDAAGNSTASPSASLTTPALPGMATNLRLVNVSATQATIAWNAGAPGTQTGFFVWRSTDGGATWTLATSTSQLGYVATGLTSGRNYRFRVQAWNAFGIAPTSSTLQVNTP